MCWPISHIDACMIHYHCPRPPAQALAPGVWSIPIMVLSDCIDYRLELAYLCSVSSIKMMHALKTLVSSRCPGWNGRGWGNALSSNSRRYWVPLRPTAAPWRTPCSPCSPAGSAQYQPLTMSWHRTTYAQLTSCMIQAPFQPKHHVPIIVGGFPADHFSTTTAFGVNGGFTFLARHVFKRLVEDIANVQLLHLSFNFPTH